MSERVWDGASRPHRRDDVVAVEDGAIRFWKAAINGNQDIVANQREYPIRVYLFKKLIENKSG